MGLLSRKGQAIVQYMLVAVVIVGVAFAFVPVFQETNSTLVINSARRNPENSTGEAVYTEPAAPEIIMPGLPSPPPPAPPPLPGTPPAPTGNLCGPFGCGTRDLPTEEGICFVIPGAAGIQTNGCWICDHSYSMWYWETDMTACGDFWYGDISSLCASKCTTIPPFYGPNYIDRYCYVCTNSGTNTGFWQRRGYLDEPQPVERFQTGCTNWWTVPNPPATPPCYTSNITYAVGCGCGGIPPAYGSLVNPISGSESCWICEGSQWINTLQLNNPGPCTDMWLKDACPVYIPQDNDFPFCGCPAEPPGNQRGPDGIDVDECWICSSGSWIKETDGMACDNFWINDNCPAPVIPPLICGDANPLPNPDTLPIINPGFNNCWLCTNPMEAFQSSTYDSTGNPLYENFAIPCEQFWVYEPEDYPAFLNIPNNPDNVETVCGNALSALSLPSPGITYDPVNNQWGCWTCQNATSNFQWVYWYGGRFNRLGNGPNAYTPQYKACDNFWMKGLYTAKPADPPLPLTCGDALPTTDPGYGSCWLCTNPKEPYFISTYDYSKASPIYKPRPPYTAPCPVFWHVTTPDYPAYITVPDGPGNPDKIDNVCSDPLPLTDGTKKPGIIYNNATGEWGCWLCTSGGNYTWISWLDGRFDHDLEDEYKACENFWMKGTYPTTIPAPPVIEPSAPWMYEYGGGSSDWGESLTVSNDGYIYVTGHQYSSTAGGADIFVMKIDSTNGFVVWRKRYGGSEYDNAKDIKIDGSYIYITGYQTSDTEGNNDLFVMKIDADTGNCDGTGGTWKKRYGGIESDVSQEILIVNNHLYITGFQYSEINGTTNNDIFVMKIDKNNGNCDGTNWTWKKRYGGLNRTDESFSITSSTSGGSIYITGETNSIADGLTHIFVMKIYGATGDCDGTGGSWKRFYGGTVSDGGRSIALDGSYIYVTGEYNSPTVGQATDIFVMKINSTNGDCDGTGGTWKKIYGGTGNDRVQSISAPGDGYIYITGLQYSEIIGGSADIFVMKIDANTGNCDGTGGTWKKRYGGIYGDAAFKISVVGNYFYVTGYEGSDNNAPVLNTGTDLFLIVDRTDSPIFGQDWSGNFSSSDWNTNYTTDTLSSDFEGIDLPATASWSGADLTDAGWNGIQLNPPGWSLEGTTLDDEIIDWSAEPSVPWMYEYGGVESDIGKVITAASDGFIYVAGEQISETNGNFDIFIMRLDMNGTVDWKRYYGGSDSDKVEAMLVFPLPWGKIMIVGSQSSDTEGGANSDMFLMHINSLDGGVYWKKRYGGTLNEVFRDFYFSEAFLHYCLYSTGIEYSESGDEDAVVMKICFDDLDAVCDPDTDNRTWKKRYGGSGFDQSFSIATNTSGEIFIAGSQSTEVEGEYDIFIMKIQDNPDSINNSGDEGSPVWKKRYGGTFADIARKISLSDDKIFITGEQSSHKISVSSLDNIFVMSVSQNNGTVLWKKVFGEDFSDNQGHSLVYDNGFVYVVGHSGDDIVVLKLDDNNNGNLVWKRIYGGLASDIGWDISVLGNYFYITGTEASDTNGPMNSGDDIFVIADRIDTPTQGSVWVNGKEGDWDTNFVTADITDPGYDGVFLPNAVSWEGIDLPSPSGWDGSDITNIAIPGWTLEGTSLDEEQLNEGGW